MSDEEVCRIERKTIEHLENDEWTPNQFVPSVFGALVERLHDIKQYDLNRELAEYLPLADILKSEHAFECAYAYAEKEQPFLDYVSKWKPSFSRRQRRCCHHRQNG